MQAKNIMSTSTISAVPTLSPKINHDAPSKNIILICVNGLAIEMGTYFIPSTHVTMHKIKNTTLSKIKPIDAQFTPRNTSSCTANPTPNAIEKTINAHIIWANNVTKVPRLFNL